ncbi:MAG: hypothetical protein HRU06_12835 [Oceanospirillaceae bacterium]|nr:hypothetical protein [Oceanospirillaceae bacterium]
MTRKQYGIIEKSKFDYVTDVDKSLEQAIAQFILEQYPGHKVIGEESIQ